LVEQRAGAATSITAHVRTEECPGILFKEIDRYIDDRAPGDVLSERDTDRPVAHCVSHSELSLDEPERAAATGEAVVRNGAAVSENVFARPGWCEWDPEVRHIRVELTDVDGRVCDVSDADQQHGPIFPCETIERRVDVRPGAELMVATDVGSTSPDRGDRVRRMRRSHCSLSAPHGF
jgi:hypothetical protein